MLFLYQFFVSYNAAYFRNLTTYYRVIRGILVIKVTRSPVKTYTKNPIRIDSFYSMLPILLMPIENDVDFLPLKAALIPSTFSSFVRNTRRIEEKQRDHNATSHQRRY